MEQSKVEGPVELPAVRGQFGGSPNCSRRQRDAKGRRLAVDAQQLEASRLRSKANCWRIEANCRRMKANGRQSEADRRRLNAHGRWSSFVLRPPAFWPRTAGTLPLTTGVSHPTAGVELPTVGIQHPAVDMCHPTSAVRIRPRVIRLDWFRTAGLPSGRCPRGAGSLSRLKNWWKGGRSEGHLLIRMRVLAPCRRILRRKWMVFLQDTNALSFRGVPALLGNSAARDLDLNFCGIPRQPKEEIGALATLVCLSALFWGGPWGAFNWFQLSRSAACFSEVAPVV